MSDVIAAIRNQDSGVYHIVRDYEAGKSGEGTYAVARCGFWAHESHVTRDARVDLVWPVCRKCKVARDPDDGRQRP